MQCRLLIVDSIGRRNTLVSWQGEGVLQMERRRRIRYTEEQKALMWDRWQQGESLHAIAALFDRNHSSIASALGRTGGIRPPQPTRDRAEPALVRRLQRRVHVGQPQVLLSIDHHGLQLTLPVVL